MAGGLSNEQKAKAQALLDAAEAYWESWRHEPDFRAVRWLEDKDGRVVVFTRGEHRDAMMAAIDDATATLYFDQDDADEISVE